MVSLEMHGYWLMSDRKGIDQSIVGKQVFDVLNIIYSS